MRGCSEEVGGTCLYYQEKDRKGSKHEVTFPLLSIWRVAVEVVWPNILSFILYISQVVNLLGIWTTQDVNCCGKVLGKLINELILHLGKSGERFQSSYWEQSSINSLIDFCTVLHWCWDNLKFFRSGELDSLSSTVQVEVNQIQSLPQ